LEYFLQEGVKEGKIGGKRSLETMASEERTARETKRKTKTKQLNGL
jgi:hypothetical protein